MLVGGLIGGLPYDSFTEPSRQTKKFLLRACYMFCPGCGCETGLHDGVIRMGNEVIAHCTGCGPCWRSARTEFPQTVVERLSRAAGHTGAGQLS